MDYGADIVGIGDLSMIESNSRKNMPYGICVAVAIPTEVIEGISKAPTVDYFNTYHKLNEKLDFLVTKGAEFLIDYGYEAYAQTKAVVSNNQTEYDTLLPHKTVATHAGIGWIGKCALLVTNDYGSAVRISTILNLQMHLLR